MTKRSGMFFKEIARLFECGSGSRVQSRIREISKGAILACALALPAAAATAQHLDAAKDLARAAREGAASGRAVLVLFSEKDCVWCERTRREFLLPMQRNAAYREKLVFQQVNVGSEELLEDFQGRPTTHAALARRYKVKLMPTVMLFGAAGEPLAEPMVGFTGSDYYGYYLDQRIETAVAKIRAR